MNWRAFSCAALLGFALGSGPTAGAAAADSHGHDMAGMEPMPAADRVPGDSLYQLPVMLTTAEGATLKLSDLRGQPLVITMFYTHCTSICPLVTAQLQRLMSHLSPAAQHQVHVLMVSFDSLRDTPEVLSAFKAEHHIRGTNWVIARASASDVRSLAAALGIRYRELADHSFNHSAVISVADRDGTIRNRTSQLTGADKAFLHAVQAQIASPGH
jgi:protein SCO1/2